jgi:hypothetical protein
VLCGQKQARERHFLYKSAHPDTKDTFSTTWLPSTSTRSTKEGVDKRQYYKSKFGEGRTQMIFERLDVAGRKLVSTSTLVARPAIREIVIV